MHLSEAHKRIRGAAQSKGAVRFCHTGGSWQCEGGMNSDDNVGWQPLLLISRAAVRNQRRSLTGPTSGVTQLVPQQPVEALLIHLVNALIDRGLELDNLLNDPGWLWRRSRQSSIVVGSLATLRRTDRRRALRRGAKKARFAHGLHQCALQATCAGRQRHGDSMHAPCAWRLPEPSQLRTVPSARGALSPCPWQSLPREALRCGHHSGRSQKGSFE
eukprot:CAMPEP_0194482520 /NCGR_PEP_ID=MMETSP0253-20130528/4430_1 /TAXON_ID=2966 /ORGANISM="Noctiluca scintillans" /LENGTH=215 /DNA_ID=CAMNT_0039322061 /DNA_START=285 /DNA_END=930 /DNA_ORIENTATION=-